MNPSLPSSSSSPESIWAISSSKAPDAFKASMLPAAAAFRASSLASDSPESVMVTMILRSIHDQRLPHNQSDTSEGGAGRGGAGTYDPKDSSQKTSQT